MKWRGHHFLLRQLFSKACPDIFFADCPILQKGYHNIVNIILNTSTLSMNVAIMLWRCFLTFCGNVAATFLKLSWNMLQHRFHNYPSTLWQCFCNFRVWRWGKIRWGHFHNCCSTFEQCSWIRPTLQQRISRQLFHNFRSTLWQRSRNFPGIRWCNVICKRFPNFH